MKTKCCTARSRRSSSRSIELNRRVDDEVRQLSQSRQEVIKLRFAKTGVLRQSIAKLNIKVQDLEKEKMEIERNSDKALREIESTLDNLLLNSVSKSLNPPRPPMESPQ